MKENMSVLRDPSIHIDVYTFRYDSLTTDICLPPKLN